MDPARGEPLRVLAELLEARLDDPYLVGLVVDRERRAVAEPLRLAAQDPPAGGVEGEDPDRARGSAEDPLEPLAHLGRSLVREGDGEDLVRLHAVRADQVGDAVGEHARLPRPGAGDHEQRPVDVERGLALGGIELGEELLVRRDGHASMLAAPRRSPGRRVRTGRGRTGAGRASPAPVAWGRAPVRDSRRHPARCRDAPACLAGADHHRRRDAPLPAPPSPTHAEEAWFAYEDDGVIVGWATAGRSWYVDAPDVGGLDLCVDPSRRGEGIGTALAEAVDEHLARHRASGARAAGRSTSRPRGRSPRAAASARSARPRCRRSTLARSRPLPVPPGVELRRLRRDRRSGADLRARPGGLAGHPERGVRPHRASRSGWRRSGARRSSTTTRAWSRTSTASSRGSR